MKILKTDLIVFILSSAVIVFFLGLVINNIRSTDDANKKETQITVSQPANGINKNDALEGKMALPVLIPFAVNFADKVNIFRKMELPMETETRLSLKLTL